ncbi:MAG: hypothetical protein ACRDBH_02290 [Bosea sp. (in: a-proteobacteria)]
MTDDELDAESCLAVTKDSLYAIMGLIKRQASDDGGCNFIPETASEGLLQQELKSLHMLCIHMFAQAAKFTIVEDEEKIS